MANTWKLYRNSEILPEKNFRVDDIETYLATLANTVTITKGQYIKHDLAISIKLDMSQETLNLFKYANSFNYMSIINDDTESSTAKLPVYYFIVSKKWISEKTILLNLVMDTVNTFTENRSSFEWSDRTLVNREHKDRFTHRNARYVETKITQLLKGYSYYLDLLTWEILGKATITSSTGIRLRKFNSYGEVTSTLIVNRIRCTLGVGLHRMVLESYDGSTYTQLEVVIPSLYRTMGLTYVFTFTDFEVDFNEAAALNFSGYYVGARYERNIDLYSEGLTPVLFKKEMYSIDDDKLDWFLVYENQNDPSEILTNPVNCYLYPSEEIKIKANSITFTTSDIDSNHGIVALGIENTGATIYVDNNALTSLYGNKIYNIYIYRDGTKLGLQCWETTKDSSLIDPTHKGIVVKGDSIKIVGGNNGYNYLISNVPQSIDDLQTLTTVNFYVDDEELELSSITSIDRTEAKLIKIIKLPYCPSTRIKERVGSGEWIYDTTNKRLVLNDLNKKFFNQIFDNEHSNPFSNLSLGTAYFTNSNTESPKDSILESKLYHSDYYQPKFVYDSFGFVFQLERMNIPDVYGRFYFNFITTTTINSRFMFEFPQYQSTNYGKEDYNNILPVIRNNEVTIFNQQYMNYLRAGYNYDVKSKNRTEAASVIGTAISLVGAVASFASVGVTGGLGVAAGVGLLTGGTASFVSTVNTIATAEQNLEAKQTQLKNQATSVAGADDVDLMNYYTGNKAKFVLYQVSPKMKKALWDMFFYTGYISGEMKIPTFNSRVWFNFISCEPQFESISNIPDSCLDNLKERYKGGVTIMHHHNNKWNWGRNFENWETSLNINDPE